MTLSPQIQLLLEDRRLSAEQFSDDEIIAMWRRAVGSWQDTSVNGLSLEGAFTRAYDAARQAAVAVLAAEGFRVKGGQGHHYITFHALDVLKVPTNSEFGAKFESVRASRHTAVYDSDSDPALLKEDLRKLRDVLEEFLPAVRTKLASRRPSIDSKLDRM